VRLEEWGEMQAHFMVAVRARLQGRFSPHRQVHQGGLRSVERRVSDEYSRIEYAAEFGTRPEEVSKIRCHGQNKYVIQKMLPQELRYLGLYHVATDENSEPAKG
jgi:hypothetical protein